VVFGCYMAMWECYYEIFKGCIRATIHQFSGKACQSGFTHVQSLSQLQHLTSGYTKISTPIHIAFTLPTVPHQPIYFHLSPPTPRSRAQPSHPKSAHLSRRHRPTREALPRYLHSTGKASSQSYTSVCNPYLYHHRGMMFTFLS